MRGLRELNAPSTSPLAAAPITYLEVMLPVLSAFTVLFCFRQHFMCNCTLQAGRYQQLTTTIQPRVFQKVCCYECLKLHVMKALCRLIWPIYLMLQCIFKFKWQLKAQGADLIITQVFFPLLFSFCCCYSNLACCVMGSGLVFFPSNTPSTHEKHQRAGKSTLLSRMVLSCSSQITKQMQQNYVSSAVYHQTQYFIHQEKMF